MKKLKRIPGNDSARIPFVEALACGLLFLSAIESPNAKDLNGSQGEYRVLAGSGLGRRTPPAGELRNRDLQDQIHVLGLYLNLRGGPGVRPAPNPVANFSEESGDEPAGTPAPRSSPRSSKVKHEKSRPEEPHKKALAGIFYRAQFALLVRPGSRYFERVPNIARENTGAPAGIVLNREKTAPPASNLYVLPGRDLFIGLDPGYCGDCEILLGNADPASEAKPAALEKGLMGDRGSATGLHVRFAHKRFGELRVLPYFLPGVSDARVYSPERETGGVAAVFYDSNFNNVRKSAASGSRVEYRVSFHFLELGVFYSRREQNGRKGELRSEYTGFGLGTRLDNGLFAYISLERMLGDFRARETDARRRGETPPQPSGGALRTGGGYRRGDFLLSWNLFLPEPARTAADDRGTTGYILAGENPADSFLLGGTLKARPAPRTRDIADASPETNPGPSLGFEHAGVFRLRTTYDYGSYGFSLGLDFLQPLQQKSGGNPFAIKKKDADAYLEVSLELSMRLGGGSRARLAYSRLHHRGAAGRSTAGEAFYFMLEYAP